MKKSTATIAMLGGGVLAVATGTALASRYILRGRDAALPFYGGVGAAVLGLSGVIGGLVRIGRPETPGKTALLVGGVGAACVIAVAINAQQDPVREPTVR